MIEGDVVRNAIYDNGVAGRLCHAYAADTDELGLNAFDLHGVDLVDQSAGEGVFHTEQNTNLLHVILQLVTNLRGRSLVRDRRARDKFAASAATRASRGRCCSPRPG